MAFELIPLVQDFVQGRSNDLLNVPDEDLESTLKPLSAQAWAVVFAMLKEAPPFEYGKADAKKRALEWLRKELDHCRDIGWAAYVDARRLEAQHEPGSDEESMSGQPSAHAAMAPDVEALVDGRVQLALQQAGVAGAVAVPNACNRLQELLLDSEKESGRSDSSEDAGTWPARYLEVLERGWGVRLAADGMALLEQTQPLSGSVGKSGSAACELQDGEEEDVCEAISAQHTMLLNHVKARPLHPDVRKGAATRVGAWAVAKALGRRKETMVQAALATTLQRDDTVDVEWADLLDAARTTTTLERGSSTWRALLYALMGNGVHTPGDRQYKLTLVPVSLGTLENLRDSRADIGFVTSGDIGITRDAWYEICVQAINLLASGQVKCANSSPKAAARGVVLVFLRSLEAGESVGALERYVRNALLNFSLTGLKAGNQAATESEKLVREKAASLRRESRKRTSPAKRDAPAKATKVAKAAELKANPP